MTTLYGITTCETVRKTRQWLRQQGVTYRYHDLREDGLDLTKAESWVTQCGPDTLINRRSTTWKNLDATLRSGLDRTNAAALIVQYPTLVKRPILEINGSIHVGFSPSIYSQIFSKQRNN